MKEVKKPISPTELYGVQRSPMRSYQDADPSPPLPSKWLVILVFLLVIVLIWAYFREPKLPGVRGLKPPIQVKLKTPLRLPSPTKGFTITATHRYTLKALVLSARRYRFDAPAKISPLDLAVGWGIIAMNPYVNKIKWSQYGRFGHFRYGSDIPFSNHQIGIHFANTHIIPQAENPELRKALFRIKRGQLVELKGYLVYVKFPKSNRPWASSTIRTDTGGGACEIMYVTDVETLPIPSSN